MASTPLGRRRFLGLGAAGAAGLAVTQLDACWRRPRARPARALGGDPFTLGVASGEPTGDGAVLWTRLATDPLAGGGMPATPILVQWQVATDDRFHHVVASGDSPAVPELGHSVHAEVRGLAPHTWHWYRFRVGGALSPAGRVRTTTAAHARLDRVAFALTSCQQYSAGYFTGHRHMAGEDLDVVVQVGDYVYEGAPDPTSVRRHEGAGEAVTIEQYRNRHAQYRMDPDLQACHAAFPWLVVLDDHEVADNWAADAPGDASSARSAFLARRHAALQAHYEHMPLRRSSIPRGIDVQLYRRSTFGDLLDVHLLDTRQYRSAQDQTARLDPARTVLGDVQERWLLANLAGRTARWNALAQQVFFSQRDFAAGAPTSFNEDAWDNYVPAGDALRDHIAAVATSNPVILTGDVHSSYVCDVKADFADPSSATVASELVGTSLSSGGDGMANGPDDAVQLAENPHITFIDRRRGYLRSVVTPDTWTADYRVLDRVTTPDSPVRTAASFVIAAGRPGPVRA